MSRRQKVTVCSRMSVKLYVTWGNRKIAIQVSREKVIDVTWFLSSRISVQSDSKKP